MFYAQKRVLAVLLCHCLRQNVCVFDLRKVECSIRSLLGLGPSWMQCSVRPGKATHPLSYTEKPRNRFLPFHLFEQLTSQLTDVPVLQNSSSSLLCDCVICDHLVSNSLLSQFHIEHTGLSCFINIQHSAVLIFVDLHLDRRASSKVLLICDQAV